MNNNTKTWFPINEANCRELVRALAATAERMSASGAEVGRVTGQVLTRMGESVRR